MVQIHEIKSKMFSCGNIHLTMEVFLFFSSDHWFQNAMYVETYHLPLFKMSKSKLNILGLWSWWAVPGTPQEHRHLSPKAFLIVDSSIFAIFKAQVSLIPKPFVTFLGVARTSRVGVNLGYLYLSCHLLSTAWQILPSWQTGSLHLWTPMHMNEVLHHHKGTTQDTALQCFSHLFSWQ